MKKILLLTITFVSTSIFSAEMGNREAQDLAKAILASKEQHKQIEKNTKQFIHMLHNLYCDINDLIKFANNHQVDVNATTKLDMRTEIISDTGKRLTKGSTVVDFLTAAAELSSANLINLFMRKGAKINPKNIESSPLLRAVNNGDHQITYLLLQYEADFNVQDHFGRTPLHLLVEGHRDTSKQYCDKCMHLVETLINLGADVTIENNFGQTADQIAQTEEFRNLLKEEKLRKLEILKQVISKISSFPNPIVDIIMKYRHL